MDRLCLAPLVLALAAAAQKPAAPAVATDTTIWSAPEGAALGHLQRLLDGTKGASGHALRLPPGGLRVPGYRVLCYARGEDEEIVEARSATFEQGILLLAWPESYTQTTRRGIALHGDGTAMCCDLTENDVPPPEATLITGKGSRGKFADLLRQPGSSESGHFWLWLQQVSKRVSINIVDENGAPRPDCKVAFVTETMGRSIDEIPLPEGPWPLGQAVTDKQGKARITGPRCNDVRAHLVTSDNVMIIDGVDCEVTKDGLRFVIDREAVRLSAIRRTEAAAVATLRNISSAQAQCQASGVIDVNENGAGEYGYFGELTGSMEVRSEKGEKIAPPVLSHAFAAVASSSVLRDGYLFRIYLPDAKGLGVAEAETGGGKDRGVDPKLAEVLWCCYAWPSSPDSGQRAFFVNQGGDIMASANGEDRKPIHCGIAGAPAFEAAYVLQGNDMQAEIAASKTGNNGQQWQVVH